MALKLDISAYGLDLENAYARVDSVNIHRVFQQKMIIDKSGDPVLGADGGNTYEREKKYQMNITVSIFPTKEIAEKGDTFPVVQKNITLENADVESLLPLVYGVVKLDEYFKNATDI